MVTLTGIIAECQQTRSQLQNRDRAMRMLKARLYQSMMGKETEQRDSARKQQVTDLLSQDYMYIYRSLIRHLSHRFPLMSDSRWAHALSQTGSVPTTSARIVSQTTGLDTLQETLRSDSDGVYGCCVICPV